MALWLRIDEDLIGGTDDAGCYHRPEALAAVLPLWEEPIRVWLQTVGGYDPAPSRDETLRIARRLLRQLGAGRADAYAEEREEIAEETGRKGIDKGTRESKIRKRTK